MIINQESLRAVSKGFNKVFNDAFRAQKPQYKKVSTVIENVSTLSVDYKWLGDIPDMREWIGDKVVRDLSAYEYTIQKKDWESTIEVDRDNILYDNLGIVKPRIEMMGHSAARNYDKLIFGLMESNGACYDGKSFFATDHAVGTQTFSNLGNAKLSQTSFLAARNEMRGLVSDEGTPLGIVGNLLVIPPELEETAIRILKADTLANGESNVTKGMAEYIVVDYLTDPNAWYLLDTTRPLKPFILQINKKPTFVAQDDPKSDNVFMRKKFRFSAEAEHNGGYGLWQLAYKSTGTA